MRRTKREIERLIADDIGGAPAITSVVIAHHSYGSGTFDASVDPDQPDPEPVSSTTTEQPNLTVTIERYESAASDDAE